jgi:hypothetical protein
MSKFYPEMVLKDAQQLERDSVESVEFCLENLGVRFEPDLSSRSIDVAAPHAMARPEDSAAETEYREALMTLLPFYVAAAIRRHTSARWAVDGAKSSHYFGQAYLTGYGDCPWDCFFPSQVRAGLKNGDRTPSSHLEKAIEFQTLATRVLETASAAVQGAKMLAIDDLMLRLVALKLVPDAGSGPFRHKTYRQRVVYTLRKSGLWKKVPKVKDVYAVRQPRSKAP